MPFFYICFIWVGFYFKHKVRLIGISNKTSRHKFYCTVCITLSYFSTLRTGDFQARIENRSYSKVKKPGKDQRKWLKLSNKAKSASSEVPNPVPGPSFVVSRDQVNSVVSREQARSRNKKAGRIWSYDEIRGFYLLA